jgi:L,D-peptidoglycan transpeptidase YkuD (ErfK/YbiS/YcfS/YnhG family)
VISAFGAREVEEQTVMSRLALRASAALGVAYALVVGIAFIRASVVPEHASCPSGGRLIMVDTRTRVLCLCRDGKVDGQFRAVLGRGGVDKRREGDGRTPLGRYSLGEARPSSRYHLFLPVGFPTAEQRAHGYSGSDVGVHGPHAALAWLLHATAWVDWTTGCIAVATTRQAELIAKWVHDAKARDILIL